MAEQYELFATCAKGLEGLVADELRALGVEGVRPLASGVAFRADGRQMCSSLLWLRCASRVLLVVGRVGAATADELYEGCKSLPWEEHVDAASTIAVHAKGENKALRNSRFTALKVKDAVCDRLVERCGSRPSVDAADPDAAIRVNVHRDKATVYLDLCGAPLHVRGYREPGVQAEAPIKETLAAAVLAAGDWPRIAREGGCLVDPFCGSGTLAIEGALMACDVAPGIFREKWGIHGWKRFDEALLDEVLDEADARAEAGMERCPRIVGNDIDRRVLEQAAANARRAGLGSAIEFVCGDVGSFRPAGLPEAGLIATNPPYGERLLSAGQLASVYVALRDLAAWTGPSWSLSAIVTGDLLDSVLGRHPEGEIATFNGPIEASIKTFDFAAEASGVTDAAAPAQGEEFANRLRKMARHRGKWARKAGVTCYRVYDADLPDFAMSIDLYQGAGGESGHSWVNVSEYAPPKTIDPALATARMNSAISIIRDQFGVGASDVFVTRRVRSKGGSQYDFSQRTDGEPQRHTVFEGGHLFEVSFGARLDTGLFLDSRIIRQIIQENSAGKRFLNLFAYTGTATVYAVAGGAKSTHTVDLSQTYLDWARDNLRLNHLDGPDHTFERADVVPWVSETRHSSQRFDLIYVDPPTFSNSKRMRGASWDVQRDHVELLIGVSRLLAPGGSAIFCCNLKGFKPDVEALLRAKVGLVDITAKTIPPDFERGRAVHHCYIVKHLGS